MPDNAVVAALEPIKFPVKPGDWVEDRSSNGDVARVKDIHFVGGEFVVDLYMYDRDGTKAGRRSPVMGGPRSFEPACSWEFWVRIEEPEFPIVLREVDNGDGTYGIKYTSGAKVLPNREWVRPQPRRFFGSRQLKVGNYDPELEASSRRLAAEQLRRTARSFRDPAVVADLIQRAEALEQAAADIRAGKSVE